MSNIIHYSFVQYFTTIFSSICSCVLHYKVYSSGYELYKYFPDALQFLSKMESSSSLSSFSVTSFFSSPSFGIISTNNNDYCCIYYYTVSYCGTRSDKYHISHLSLHYQRQISSHFVAMVLHLLITIITFVFITIFNFVISNILYTISIMFYLQLFK